MEINRKPLILLASALATIALSVLVVPWASEKFFFDKFYYYKSVLHGYWVPNKNLTLKDFGERGQDIASLSNFIHDPQYNTLGMQTDKNVFTIAVIGDSFVWGQGIKEQNRFVNILKHKLSRVRPTKILSFAASGDGIVDSYIKYVYVRKNISVDLFLFTIHDNDLLLREENPYDDTSQQRIVAACGAAIIVDPPNDPTTVYEDEYRQALIKSYNDKFGNRCIFRFVLDQLPKQRAKYFYYGRFFWEKSDLKEALSEYKQRGLNVFSSDNTLEKERAERLVVSPSEPHPSALANKLFADAIYDEIVKLDYFYQ